MALKAKVQIKIDLPVLKSDFFKLKEALEEIASTNPTLAQELAGLAKIEDGLDELTLEAEKKELAKPLNKLGRFLEKIGENDSRLNKILEGTKKGMYLARKLGRTYNKFAQWLALPQVPDIFPGKDMIPQTVTGENQVIISQPGQMHLETLSDSLEKITANIPSGVGSYEEIREKNCYYVDKSGYLRDIEKAGMYLFFIRPRRFGKTLFISMMETYYDVDKKEQFEFYFTGTAIFENPTPERNSYLILKLDFSGIESSVEQVEKSFLNHVKNRGRIFISKYKNLLNIDEKETIAEIKNQENPSDILSLLLTLCEIASRKIYIIIDEYDNFANTILSTAGEKDYEALTHGEGFFKTFFAAIKKGTSGSGIPIGRLFMTGVSPITLDDVTSGFNIGENISIDRAFNEMLGFRQQEVIDLIEYYRRAGIIRHETAYLFDIMNDWYNHYRFCKESGPTVFNPTLVMYFLKEYRKNYKIPDDLVDRNVRTDYEKLRHLILIDKMGAKKPNGNFSKLQAVIENAFVTTKLQKSFSLKKLTQPENFYTLLFYFGLLTIDGVDKNEQSRLTIPNETVKRLYYEYIKDVYTEMEIFTLDLDDYYRMMADMAYKGKWKPMFDYISKRMEAGLGLRDLIDREKMAQVFLVAYLGLSNLYFTHSEKELGKGYADIVLEPFMAKYEGIKYSYLIEIKYMKPFKNKEKEKEKLEKLKADAGKQLDKYSMDEKFAKSIGKTVLIKLILVFSGHRLVYIDAVGKG
ncbi:MAG: AAA family ATPase [Candidatus Aminicenantes bacterium]|nr:AAA family ATPase [Candidatus Aminicenantes bacterium]